MMSLNRKIYDLLKRVEATCGEITHPAATPKPKVDTSSRSANESATLENVNEDVSADYSYGDIDRRGQQPGEHKVRIRQGGNFVDIYYNPSTREARPIYKGV
jgi:hypothetical protein